MSFLALFWPFYTKVPSNYRRSETEWAPTTIIPYHTLIVCYLLDYQSQCPVWQHSVPVTSLILHYHFNWHGQNLLSLMQFYANYRRVKVLKSHTDVYV